MKNRISNVAFIISIPIIPFLIIYITILVGYDGPMWMIGIWLGTMPHIFDAMIKEGKIWYIFSQTRRDKIVLIICQFFIVLSICLTYFVEARSTYSVFIITFLLFIGLLVIPITTIFLLGSEVLKSEVKKDVTSEFWRIQSWRPK